MPFLVRSLPSIMSSSTALFHLLSVTSLFSISKPPSLASPRIFPSSINPLPKLFSIPTQSSRFVRRPFIAPSFDLDEYLSDEEQQAPNYSPYLKLYVGNLPWNVDSVAFAGLFQRAGNVEMVEIEGKCKCFRDALGIFKLTAIKDIYSWNSIIGVHQQAGDYEGTLKLFDQMLCDKVFSPDLVTVTTVLPACCHLAALSHGKEIHAYMITKGLAKKEDNGAEDRADDTYINNAIMDMYGKCGCMREARLVFDHMSSKDSASWNIMIMGYAMHGFGNEALDLFQKMCEKSLTPDEVTFFGVLSACSHAGLVNEGQEYLSQMNSSYYGSYLCTGHKLL